MKIMCAFSLLFIANFAMAANCDLPKGEVDFMESYLMPSGEPTGPAFPALVTQIAPSKDCRSIRVWQYIPGKDGKKVVPTDQECDQQQGSDVARGPLLTCTTYKVYHSEEDAKGKPLPRAYVKDGALITRSYTSFGGTLSSVYLMNGHGKRVIGMMQIALPYSGGSIGGIGLIGGIGGVSTDKAKSGHIGGVPAGGYIGSVPIAGQPH